MTLEPFELLMLVVLTFSFGVAVGLSMALSSDRVD